MSGAVSGAEAPVAENRCGGSRTG